MKRIKRAVKKILGIDSQRSRFAIASVYEEYADADWVPLYPEERHPTPEVLDMKLDSFYAHLKQPSYTAPALRTAILPAVNFCPVNDIVYTEDDVIIAETTGPGARAAGIDWSAIEKVHPEKSIDGPATALRCPFKNHYHLLVDNLPRLLLLHHPHFRSFPKIKVLCPGGATEKESFFLSHLLPPNAVIENIPAEGPYQIEEYLFLPFSTIQGSGYLHRQLVKTYRELLGISCARKATERIYISRRKATSRRVVNESDLFPELGKRGFQVCLLEEMSIEEQIDLFQRAKCVVGPHGAGLANVLFSNDLNVLELFGSGHIATHYYLLSKSLGHRYGYLSFSSVDRVDSDFRVDEEKLIHHIDQLA